MNNDDEVFRRRIAELEAENHRLKDTLEFVKAERKELRDELYGPAKIEKPTTDEELIAIMQSHVPGSGTRLIAELGLAPGNPL